MDRQERILQAVLDLLAEHGIAGVSLRAVAKRAGVSLGLLSYHYEDKRSLVGAALHRVEEQDVALVHPDDSLAPEERLRPTSSGARRRADRPGLADEDVR